MSNLSASSKSRDRRKSKKLKFHGDRTKFRAFRDDLKSYLGTISKATHLLKFEATVSPDGTSVTFSRSLQSKFAIRAREIVEDDFDDEQIDQAMYGQTYLQVVTGPISVQRVLQAAVAAGAEDVKHVQAEGVAPAAAAAAAEAQEEQQPADAGAEVDPAAAVDQAGDAAARLAAYNALGAADKAQITLIRKNIRKEYRKKLRKLHDQILQANHDMYDDIRDACAPAVKKNVFVKDQVPSSHGMAAWQKLAQEYDLKTAGTAMIAKRNFWDLRMGRKEKLDDFITTIMEKAEDLAAHKLLVDDRDKVIVLLQGVPASYNLPVSQLMNRQDVTFAQACHDLRVHKMTLLKKKSRNQQSSDDEKSQRRRRRKKKDKSDKKHDHSMLAGNAARANPCFNCGKTDGHRAKDCKGRKSKCGKCKKEGHQTRFCEDIQRITAIMESRRNDQQRQPSGSGRAYLAHSDDSSYSSSDSEREHERRRRHRRQKKKKKNSSRDRRRRRRDRDRRRHSSPSRRHRDRTHRDRAMAATLPFSFFAAGHRQVHATTRANVECVCSHVAQEIPDVPPVSHIRDLVPTPLDRPVESSDDSDMPGLLSASSADETSAGESLAPPPAQRHVPAAGQTSGESDHDMPELEGSSSAESSCSSEESSGESEEVPPLVSGSESSAESDAPRPPPRRTLGPISRRAARARAARARRRAEEKKRQGKFPHVTSRPVGSPTRRRTRHRARRQRTSSEEPRVLSDEKDAPPRCQPRHFNPSCTEHVTLLATHLNRVWILDSGCTVAQGVSNRPRKEWKNYDDSRRDEIGTYSSGGGVDIYARGSIGNLHNIAHAPHGAGNLLNFKQLQSSHRFRISFDRKDRVVFRDRRSGKVLCKCENLHGFWVLPFGQVPREFADLTRETGDRKPEERRERRPRRSVADKIFLSRQSLLDKTKLQLVHERLGHLNIRTLKRALKHGQLNGVSISQKDLRVPFSCEGCVKGKAHKLPYARSTTVRMTEPGQRISIDRFEISPKDIHGHRYGIVIIDWYSRYCWIFYTKTKLEDEWLPIIKTWRKMFATQTGYKVRCFYSDNEFDTIKFREWRKKHGIRHRPTTRSSSGMNAQAERAIRTIKERLRTAMLTTNVHSRFWSYAATHQVTLMNCLPHSGLRRELHDDGYVRNDRACMEIPFYRLYKEMANLRNLRLFGSKCYVLKEAGDKGYAKSRATASRTKPGIYLGFSVREGQRGYIVFLPHCDKVVVRRHVYFQEHARLKRAQLPLYLRDDHAPVNLIKHNDSDSETSSDVDSDATDTASDTTTTTNHTTEHSDDTAHETDTTDDDDDERIYRHDEDPFDSAPSSDETNDDNVYGQGVQHQQQHQDQESQNDDSGDDNGNGGDNSESTESNLLSADNDSGDVNDDDYDDDSDDDREGVEEDDNDSYDSYEDPEGDYLLPASNPRSDEDFTDDEVYPNSREEKLGNVRLETSSSHSSEEKQGNDHLDSARRRDQRTSEEEKSGNDHSDSSPPSSLSLPSTSASDSNSTTSPPPRGAPSPSPERKAAAQQPWQHTAGTRTRSGRISRVTRSSVPMLRGNAFLQHDSRHTLTLDDRCQRHLSTEERLEKWQAEQQTLTALILLAKSLKNVQASSIPTPKTYRQAVRSLERERWLDATARELQAMLDMNVFRFEELPPKCKLIKSLWVFKVKSDSQGHVTRFKARLCAKGFTQQHGVHYFATYSPVIKSQTLKIALLISCYYGWPTPRQLDFSNAYLNSRIDCELFMALPEGWFEILGYLGRASSTRIIQGRKYGLRILKSIYGLKQSGRNWNRTLRDVLKTHVGLTQSRLDECLYLLFDKARHVIALVLVFVDDCVIAASTVKLQDTIINRLRKHFKLTDQGDIDWLLGVKIRYDAENHVVEFSNQKYIEDLRSKFQKTVNFAKKVKIPIPGGHSLIPQGEQQAYRKLRRPSEPLTPDQASYYQSLIGSLMYAVTSGRPDMAHCTYQLACYLHAPTKTHLKYGHQALQYLYSTRTKTLKLPCKELNIQGYTDSNWATDSNDRKSISGYMFSFSTEGGAFSIKCKRQQTTALSSAEAELVALSLCVQEAAFLKQLFEEILQHDLKPIPIWIDNKAAQSIAQLQGSSDRMKHLDIRFHFVKEMIENKIVTLHHISGFDNPADIFTKNLAKTAFERHQSYLFGERKIGQDEAAEATTGNNL